VCRRNTLAARRRINGGMTKHEGYGLTNTVDEALKRAHHAEHTTDHKVATRRREEQMVLSSLQRAHFIIRHCCVDKYGGGGW
jgi:hypothetical protein